LKILAHSLHPTEQQEQVNELLNLFQQNLYLEEVILQDDLPRNMNVVNKLMPQLHHYCCRNIFVQTLLHPVVSTKQERENPQQ
jgi:hypothetical protein